MIYLEREKNDDIPHQTRTCCKQSIPLRDFSFGAFIAYLMGKQQ